jgi:hypothetical protein
MNVFVIPGFDFGNRYPCSIIGLLQGRGVEFLFAKRKGD